MIQEDNTNTQSKKSLKDVVQEENASSEQVHKSDMAKLRERLEESKRQIENLQQHLKSRHRTIILLTVLLVIFCAVCIALLVNNLQNDNFLALQENKTKTQTETLNEQNLDTDPIEQQANANDASAQYQMGERYYNGTNNYSKDITLSVEWYSRAALNGDIKSMLILAKLYEQGDKITKDNKSAFKYYFMAARQGNKDALYKVGTYYMNGIGVAKNMEKAIFYLSQAAEKGHKEAKALIGSADKFENEETTVTKTTTTTK